MPKNESSSEDVQTAERANQFEVPIKTKRCL